MPCEYTILYTGTLPAWIGLSVSSTCLTSSEFTVKDLYKGSFGDGPMPPQVVDKTPQEEGFTDTFTITLAKDVGKGFCSGTTYSPDDKSGSTGTTRTVTLAAQAVQSENNSTGTPPTGPENWG
jgi:hypothetical protein